MLSLRKITSQELLTVGANLIGKPVKQIELLNDEMVADITEARESYFTDAYRFENLGKTLIFV